VQNTVIYCVDQKQKHRSLLIIVGEMTSGEFTCVVGNISAEITVCGKKENLVLSDNSTASSHFHCFITVISAKALDLIFFYMTIGWIQDYYRPCTALLISLVIEE